LRVKEFSKKLNVKKSEVYEGLKRKVEIKNKLLIVSPEKKTSSDWK
jgi:hypothetical protein